MSVNVAFGELQRGRSHICICSVWRVVRVARERRGLWRESAYFSNADRAQRVDICSVLRKNKILQYFSQFREFPTTFRKNILKKLLL